MRTAESTAIFTRSWSLYDLITAHNYMFHQELYAGVENLLGQKHYGAIAYRLFDLGCGNARYLAPCLKRYPPELYEGTDLSEAALLEARKYLSDLPSQVVLNHGDLLHAIESTEQTWDVIFVGFALHHLVSSEKARFFRAAARCLSQNGWLILVDVVREENQDRANFLDNYLKFMREKWTKVPSNQLEEACMHVYNYDYPEQLSTLQEMAKIVDLNTMRVVNRYAQHYTLLFSRSA